MNAGPDPVQEVLGAFQTPDAESALRDVVRSFLVAGRTRSDVANLLETARGRITDDQEDEDEMLLDLIAVLVGMASHTAQRNLIPPPCKLPASAAVP